MSNNTVSKEILCLLTPYYYDFIEGKCVVLSFKGALDADRYIIGEHKEDGYGVYYCYNRTSIPLLLSEERLVKLCDGSSIDSIANILENKGYVNITSRGVICAKDLLELLKG